MKETVNEIRRGLTDKPVTVKGTIVEKCTFSNTAFGDGELIIDKDFLDVMNNIAHELKFDGDLYAILLTLNSKIKNYYYSDENNPLSRAATYNNSLVIDDEGMILGTKISSLKGKNIAKCSEKSLAAYIILKQLHSNGKVNWKTTLIMSSLGTEARKKEPHAFLIIDNDEKEFPFKHLLWDIENPTYVSDNDDKKMWLLGLYSLSDESRKDIEEGYQCFPDSLYSFIYDYKELGEKRIYGSRIKDNGFGGQSNS